MLGDNIREIMKRTGTTQARLADLIGMKGAGHISRILNGHVNPNSEMLEKIADALGVSVSAFYDSEAANNSVTEVILKSIPDNIKDALSDKRKEKWLLLGLDLESSPLTEEEIRMAVQIHAEMKARMKSK